MTRVVGTRKTRRRSWVHIKHEDPLREGSRGQASARTTSWSRRPLGLLETGMWLKQCLRASFFFNGKTRLGKSTSGVMLAAIKRAAAPPAPC